MVFLENFRVALEALRANKMRSILTTLGIIIGVAAVIAVVSIVQGLQYTITNELQGVGATFMVIQRDMQRNRPDMVVRQVRLTWEDGQALRERVPGIRLITPAMFGQSQVKYRERKHTPFAIIGVNQDWQDVNNHTVEQGRFFSRVDLENRRKVTVVGRKVVEELALGDDPIGKEIYIGTYPATVIGVMEKKGRAFGFDQDDMVFVPFDSAVALFGRNAADAVELRLQARDTQSVEQVKDGITQLLRTRHQIPEGQPNDFQIQTQDEILDSVNSILGSVTAVVGGIVGIALLVGGIGIMNIMLVSVTERTREIGVRKAVGARRQDVLVQFLIEAVTLSLVGGGLGLAIGYGLGVLAASVLPGDFPPAHVPLWAVFLAFGFSAMVGIFFGIYPAAKASRLDPIEALRYE
ncbi:MAG TPA: ABC transporter permease [Thermoanaerobaculia bacterium]|nr:ABC transporter permease [Thermoanaerobaculia bacterium]